MPDERRRAAVEYLSPGESGSTAGARGLAQRAAADKEGTEKSESSGQLSDVEADSGSSLGGTGPPGAPTTPREPEGPLTEGPPLPLADITPEPGPSLKRSVAADDWSSDALETGLPDTQPAGASERPDFLAPEPPFIPRVQAQDQVMRRAEAPDDDAGAGLEPAEPAMPGEAVAPPFQVESVETASVTGGFEEESRAFEAPLPDDASIAATAPAGPQLAPEAKADELQTLHKAPRLTGEEPITQREAVEPPFQPDSLEPTALAGRLEEESRAFEAPLPEDASTLAAAPPESPFAPESEPAGFQTMDPLLHATGEEPPTTPDAPFRKSRPGKLRLSVSLSGK